MKDIIMIVSDDGERRKQIAEHLTKEGYIALEVGEPARAVSIIAEERQDARIMVSDLYLPGINGVDLMEKTKRHKPELEVILISDQGTSSSAEPAMRRGAFAFLEKPLSLSSLSEKIKEALKKQMETGHGKGKILIVDDNAELRKTIQRLMTLDGYAVSEAGDGEEAVNKVRAENFDIVLMDFHMPKLTGPEAVKIIKKGKPDTYIVMMTGEADEQEVKSALALNPGHYAVLKKPFDLLAFSVSVKHLKEESEEFKRLAHRSESEKIHDKLEEEEEKVKEFVHEKGSKIGLWIALVIFCILFSAGAIWFTDTAPQFIKSMFQSAQKIEKLEKKLEKLDNVEKQLDSLPQK